MNLSRRRVSAGVAAVAVVALLVADVVGRSVLGGGSSVRLTSLPATPAASKLAAPPAPLMDVPASTLLATPVGTIPTSTSPGGAPTGTVGTWYGYQLVLPVLSQRPGWDQVRLPWRPNETTAWVHANQVTLTHTPYYIRLSLSAMHLTVFRNGQPVMRFATGIGATATPTVTGHYFVAVHQPKPDPVLGPVVLDLSAHSDAIQNWEGSGDAIIAIHGPVDSSADSQIGSTGARLSNGCIRLHTANDQQLSVIPVGTPVDIAP